MRVRATELGYYGDSLREEGAEFDIKDDVEGEPSEFSSNWMELATDDGQETEADRAAKVDDTKAAHLASLKAEDLVELTVSQLEALCDELSVDRTGVTLKADLVALLDPPASAQD